MLHNLRPCFRWNYVRKYILYFVLYDIRIYSVLVCLLHCHCSVGWVSVPALETCVWPIQGLGGAGPGGPRFTGGAELLWGWGLGEVLQRRQGTWQGGREATKVSKGHGKGTDVGLCTAPLQFALAAASSPCRLCFCHIPTMLITVLCFAYTFIISYHLHFPSISPLPFCDSSGLHHSVHSASQGLCWRPHPAAVWCPPHFPSTLHPDQPLCHWPVPCEGKRRSFSPPADHWWDWRRQPSTPATCKREAISEFCGVGLVAVHSRPCWMTLWVVQWSSATILE